MSIAALTLVWEHSAQKHSALLIMLALADYADDQGRAYPSVETLMRKARLSERQVQTTLKDLADAGEIITHPGKGPHGCNLHILTCMMKRSPEGGKVCGGADSAGGQSLRQGGANSAGGGAKFAEKGGKVCTQSVIDPSKEPLIEPSEESASVEAAPISAGSPASSSSKASSRKPSASAVRGHRLPKDWRPTVSDVDWADTEAPDVDLSRATQDFCNYWDSVPDPKGRKANWSATWRNSIMSSQDTGRFPKVRPAAGPHDSQAHRFPSRHTSARPARQTFDEACDAMERSLENLTPERFPN